MEAGATPAPVAIVSRRSTKPKPDRRASSRACRATIVGHDDRRRRRQHGRDRCAGDGGRRRGHRGGPRLRPRLSGGRRGGRRRRDHRLHGWRRRDRSEVARAARRRRSRGEVTISSSASRARGEREPGSMGSHQFIAGRLVGLGTQALYGVTYTDMCAFRAIRRDALLRLGMREMTYGWNLEMQMRAARAGLRVLEMPVPYRPPPGGTSKVAGSCAARSSPQAGSSRPSCASRPPARSHARARRMTELKS